MTPCDPDGALGVFEPREGVNPAGEDKFIDWIRVRAALDAGSSACMRALQHDRGRMHVLEGAQCFFLFTADLTHCVLLLR